MHVRKEEKDPKFKSKIQIAIKDCWTFNIALKS
jgi:hypothetical protein